MTEPIRSITELPNELTRDLDLADPLEIARLLRQSDAQLFAGWRGFPSLSDRDISRVMARLALAVAEAVQAGEKGSVLIGGAGTSGRLALFFCRQFNRLLREAEAPEVFRPLLAGGVPALVRAFEGVEDDPTVGASDLKSAIPPDAERLVYFGVTCGLSAAYVAGQMEALREDPRANVVLVGFNPIERARKVPIEKWGGRTFADAVQSFEGNARFTPLLPIYGPEPVMGSTRMKGGSATKIALETIFYTALELCGYAGRESSPVYNLGPTANLEMVEHRVRMFLLRYAATIQAIYTQTEALGELIRLGGAALRCGGQISYLGRDSAGFLAIVDASECPPTFGANSHDVRGFIRSGWKELLDEERDLAYKGDEYAIDHKAFEEERLPELSRGDLVLGVALGELGANTLRLLDAAIQKGRGTVALVVVGATPPPPESIPQGIEHFFYFQVPSLGFQAGYNNEAELGLKLCLNALTTGAHVLVGRVYHNQMIDLRISNTKLYLRAIGTIQSLTHVDEEHAREALHRSAFKKDTLGPEDMEASPSSVVKLAGSRRGVVPLALLLASTDLSVEAATQLLSADPIVRRALEKPIQERQAAAGR